MKRTFWFVFLILILLVVPDEGIAQGDTPALNLRLDRNFGYGGFGKIQGRFTLKVSGPENLTKVEFYIDERLMGTIEQFPFEHKFHTGDYEPGARTFSACGYTGDGLALNSNRITKTILSSEEAWMETQQILMPMLIIIGAFTLLGLGVPFLLGRKRDFKMGEYGPAGGAICPRCGLPFSRRVMAPNLLVGKLSHCPHCGKWVVVPRVSAENLKEAESRYQPEIPRTIGNSDSVETFKRLLEESRFEE